MKKLIISEDCIACGTCLGCTPLLTEDNLGHAVPVSSGYITKAESDSVQVAIISCAAGAISLVDDTYTDFVNSADLEELIKKFKQMIDEFEMVKPDPEAVKFIKEDYEVPGIKGPDYMSLYKYRTYEMAAREGLYVFKSSIHSKRKQLIQQLLVEYKNKHLIQFSEYEKGNSNYYHKVNMDIVNILHLFYKSAKDKNQTVNIDSDFTEFEVIPRFGVDGDKFDKERFVYAVRHIEEHGIVDTISDSIDKAEDYEHMISVDYFDGKYNYDLWKVTLQFNKDILTAIESKINDPKFGALSLLTPVIDEFKKDIRTSLINKYAVYYGALSNQ